MKKTLVYGYLEMVTMEEINEIVKAIAKDNEMAFEIHSQTPSLSSISLYGMCEESVADRFGLEPADDEFYDFDARYKSTKQLYERIQSNK